MNPRCSVLVRTAPALENRCVHGSNATACGRGESSSMGYTRLVSLAVRESCTTRNSRVGLLPRPKELHQGRRCPRGQCARCAEHLSQCYVRPIPLELDRRTLARFAELRFARADLDDATIARLVENAQMPPTAASDDILGPS